MNVLITGKPGCGKTSLVKRLLPHLPEPSGFFTEEMRDRGIRVGFSIQTLDGFRGTLAHANLVSQIRMGKYGVNIGDLEESCRHVGRGTVVIDEIGKMELFSDTFRDLVVRTLEESRLCATILYYPHPFCDKVKSRRDVSLRVLTPQNREATFVDLKGLFRRST